MLKTLARLYRDERGAVGLETLLIVAAVVLPLLGILIFYRQDIANWVKSKWETVRTDGTTAVPTAAPYVP